MVLYHIKRAWILLQLDFRIALLLSAFMGALDMLIYNLFLPPALVSGDAELAIAALETVFTYPGFYIWLIISFLVAIPAKIIWYRAILLGQFKIFEGGSNAFIQRAKSVLVITLKSMAASILAIVSVTFIVGLFLGIAGNSPLGNVLTFLAVLVGIFLVVAIFCVAEVAIMRGVTDHTVGLRMTFDRIKSRVRSLVAGAILLFIIGILPSMLFGDIFANMEIRIVYTLFNFVSSAFQWLIGLTFFAFVVSITRDFFQDTGQEAP